MSERDTRLEVVKSFSLHYIVSDAGHEYWEVHRQSDDACVGRFAGSAANQAASAYAAGLEAGKIPVRRM